MVFIISDFDHITSNEAKKHTSSAVKQHLDFMEITSGQISASGVDQNRD